MKIIVCMKQVPVKDSLLKITDDGSWVHETDLNYEINESDHYALEEALRLKEAPGGAFAEMRGSVINKHRPVAERDILGCLRS